MIWMIIFWSSSAIAFICYLINRRMKKEFLSDISGLLGVYSFLSFFIAIITNDPVFQAIGLPLGYEWIAGLGLVGFGGWRFYLKPLKERVIGCEKDIARIYVKLDNIKETFNLFWF